MHSAPGQCTRKAVSKSLNLGAAQWEQLALIGTSFAAVLYSCKSVLLSLLPLILALGRLLGSGYFRLSPHSFRPGTIPIGRYVLYCFCSSFPSRLPGALKGAPAFFHSFTSPFTPLKKSLEPYSVIYFCFQRNKTTFHAANIQKS